MLTEPTFNNMFMISGLLIIQILVKNNTLQTSINSVIVFHTAVP